MMLARLLSWCTLAAGLGAFATLPSALAEEIGVPVGRLVSAYSAALDRIENGELVWRDGTRMKIDDGKGEKSFEAWLGDPDIKDMFRYSYPARTPADPPALNVDPGRARNAAFFDHMYGSCRQDEVKKHLVTIPWVPKKHGGRLEVTSVNGVAEKLKAVSAELDELPTSFDAYLVPSAGAYNCRVIAGTNRVSAHGHGIAIDIGVKHSHYWGWAKKKAGGALTYKNEIPMEIVKIFESHGFIWGGRWHHYDTMHFEYRPELSAVGSGR